MKIRLVVAFAIVANLAALSGSAAPSDPSWGYPEDSKWGTSCEKPTTQQSPIRVRSTTSASTKVVIAGPGVFDAHDNNVTFSTQVNVSKVPGSATSNTSYTVVGYHLHSPVEHILPGSTANIELHIKATSGTNTAVFSISFQVNPNGVGNEPGDAFLVGIGAARAFPISPTIPNLTPLLANFSTQPFYAYSGSLTTPPCTGGIQWFVLAKPISYTASTWTRTASVLQSLGMPSPNSRGTKTPPATVYLTNGS